MFEKPKTNTTFNVTPSQSIDRSVKLQTISRITNREKGPAVRMAMVMNPVAKARGIVIALKRFGL